MAAMQHGCSSGAVKFAARAKGSKGVPQTVVGWFGVGRQVLMSGT